MKPKKVIFWIIFGILAYNVLGYARTHTRGDVIAYKRFAKAIMKGDDYTARQASRGDVLARALSVQSERQAQFDEVDRVFTYYVIKDRRISDDGKVAYISAEQVSRVNPEGFDTLWGEKEVRVRHGVQLILENDAWLVTEFNDPMMP